ncbi:MAG: hypothetical protein MOB07_23240 [Acidobacteria bacterium]|nr:hypothetical protein [Acidobacteriota bacterium]
MPEFRQQEASLWISKRKETVFNTPYTVGADFLQATSQNPIVLIPEIEKTDDSQRAGNSSEFPTTQCNQYWLPPAASFQDQAGFDLFGRLALRSVGGAVVDTPIAGPAHKHAANMLSKTIGLQYPSMTLISALGGADFLYPGIVSDRFRMSQEGVSPVQCQFDLIGSGKHRRGHGVGTAQVETATAAGTIGTGGNANVTITAAGMPGSPLLVTVAVLAADTPTVWAGKVRTALAAHDTVGDFFVVSGTTTAIVLTTRFIRDNDATLNIALDNGTCTGITPAPTSANTTASVVTLPAAPAFSCLQPKSFLEYTDNNGLKDLTLGCRVRSWFVEIANNHAPTDDRCIGDPTQIEGDYTVLTGAGQAAYLSKLTRGLRAISAQIVILLDSVMPEWVKMAQNIALTNVTFGARGVLLDAGGPTFESLKVIIPQAKFASVQEVDSNGKASLTLSFKAFFDATAIGAKVEVVNNIVNNFD